MSEENQQREMLAVEALTEQLSQAISDRHTLIEERNALRNELRGVKNQPQHKGLGIGSLDMEKAVLASILIGSTKQEGKVSNLPLTLVLASDVTEESFTDTRNRTIWAAIKQLNEQGSEIDELLVSAHLRATQRIQDAGGDAYLLSVSGVIDTPAHLPHYIERLLDAQTLRELSRSCLETLDGVTSGGGDIDDFLTDRIEQFRKIAAKRVKNNSIICVKDTAKEAFARIKDAMDNPDLSRGVTTGLHCLDERLGGLKAGRLYIVAARPSMGKSALGLLIAESAAKAGNGSIFFSLEMSRQELEDRLIQSMAGVSLKDTHRAKSDAAKASLNRAYKTLIGDKATKGLDLSIVDKPAFKIEQVFTVVERWKRNRVTPVVVIDYLQIMGESLTQKNANREQQIAHISRSAKALAKAHQVPVVLLAQLNRDVEKQDRLPRLSDLRESGTIEQDADAVTFISLTPEDVKDKSYRDDLHHAPRRLLFTAKQRAGGVGGDVVIFNKPITRFQAATH